jgi:hypothetical protein
MYTNILILKDFWSTVHEHKPEQNLRSSKFNTHITDLKLLKLNNKLGEI